MRSPRISLILTAALIGSCSSSPDTTPPPPGSEVTIETITACLNQESTVTDDCLDELFRTHLATHTTPETLALLQSIENENEYVRLYCHPVAHAIGRETFRIQGTIDGSFAVCDQTCHSGCYHGAMERFLRGDSDAMGHVTTEELQMKVASACDTSLSTRLQFQCLHGLGHAVLYFSGYDLFGSLELCDSAGGTWAASSCHGGVFMENLVASDPTVRNVSETDYHYPCDMVAAKYRDSCYLMQTSRMSEMGLTGAEVMDECRNAGEQRELCQQSLGRDLSNLARQGKGREASMTCELGFEGELLACTKGVIMALIDDSWDGRWALPYCTTYSEEIDRTNCFKVSADYLHDIYSKSKEDIETDCNTYVPGNTTCLDKARAF